ncbi:MAG TPA: hypothetical protein DEA55_11060 [Rhodospirillaceae bacterium]|nr:hypothetical protein [Rhodospirillaceae bacterium]
MDYSKTRVLVVDDDASVRMALRGFLCAFGFEDLNIHEAVNGREGLMAIQKAKEGQFCFDLVMTDTRMPEMDGQRMMKEIRDQGYVMPIIQLSAQDRVGPPLRHNEVFVLKPFNVDNLFMLVDALIQSKPKVLVVDDEKDTRDGVKLVLASRGYHVEEAQNGAQALAMIDGKGESSYEGGLYYDVVLSDMDMPEMDGPTLLAQLGSQSGRHQGRFISASCRPLEKQRERYAGLKPDAFMEKPFNNKAFLRTMMELLEKYRNPSWGAQPQATTAFVPGGLDL